MTTQSIQKLNELILIKQKTYDSLVQQTSIALEELNNAKTDLANYLSSARITIAILDESNLQKKTIEIYARVVEKAIAELKKHWEIPIVEVVTKPTKGAWEVTITNDHRRVGADGWHHYSPTGLAYAFILPGTGMYPFGSRFAGQLRRLIGKTWFPMKPERLRSGALTVLVHETLEMLIDPFLKTVSKPDAKGRKWLIEVCSSAVFGGYYSYQDISGQWCVLPNFSFPSNFDLEGVAPFDNLGVLNAPFTWTPKSYPYYVDNAGKLVKIT